MKTLKIALVTAFVAFALAGFSNTGEFKAKIHTKVNYITLNQAVKIPELVAAMYTQLNDDFLKNMQLVYTQEVILRGIHFKITGTRAQWILFFRHRIRVDELKVSLEPDITE